MRSSGYSWLICVVMPLAFVGIVCWLTPWLAGIEAQFYDRFVSARPARHPSKPVLVVLEDDAIHAPNLPPAEQARKRALTLQKAVENMSRASVRALVFSGGAANWLASAALPDESSRGLVDRSDRASLALIESPPENALYGTGETLSSMVLWWDVSRSRGDPVYLRKLRRDPQTTRAAGLAWQTAGGTPGANGLASHSQQGSDMVIAALRPLPRVPLWDGENVLATNWYGPQGTFCSAKLTALAAKRVTASALRNAVVVVGDAREVRTTPVGAMTHAEVHANLIETMLEDRWVRPMPTWWHWMTMFVVGIVAATAVTRTATMTAIIALLLEAAAIGMVARATLKYDFWFCCTPSLATAALSAVGALAVSLELARSARTMLTREMALRPAAGAQTQAHHDRGAD